MPRDAAVRKAAPVVFAPCAWAGCGGEYPVTPARPPGGCCSAECGAEVRIAAGAATRSPPPPPPRAPGASVTVLAPGARAGRPRRAVAFERRCERAGCPDSFVVEAWRAARPGAGRFCSPGCAALALRGRRKATAGEGG